MLHKLVLHMDTDSFSIYKKKTEEIYSAIAKDVKPNQIMN